MAPVRTPISRAPGEARVVTPLELLFDLVYISRSASSRIIWSRTSTSGPAPRR
jgi:hypothetical protein